MNTPTPENRKIDEAASTGVDKAYTRELAQPSRPLLPGSVDPGDSPASDPLLGMTVAQRYEVATVVGVGGWSVVYQAHDNNLNRPVAIKVLHSHLCLDQGKLQRFQREAESASRLNHPNIAVIYDCGDLWAGRPYISMEFIEGVSLAEMIKEKGVLDPQECLGLFSQICDGIEAIHKLGLIHRDLKPSNIKVSDSGAVKVLDFGLAKWILQEQEALTKSDESLGTPSYMSPEQCLGENLDARSDIYSVGCMMYEALTGVKPFNTDNSLKCMQMHVQTMPPSFASVRPNLKIPESLEFLVFKALAKDPRDRFASVAELKAAFSGALQPRGRFSRLFHMWQRQWQTIRRRPREFVAMVFVLVAVTIVGGQLWKSASVHPQVLDQRLQRTIVFPDHPVGTLYLLSRAPSGGDAFPLTKYADVHGAVTVPYNALVELTDVPQQEAESLECLSQLKEDDLQYLLLSDKPVTDRGLRLINRLKGLQSLNLDATQVTDAGIVTLDLPRLGGLNMRGTKITDASLMHLASPLSPLGWLGLRDTAITDKGVSKLVVLTSLNGLVLRNTKVTDGCLAQIRRLPRINLLVLAEDNITDAGVALLADVKTLKSLNLNKTKITDRSVPILCQMQSLKQLNVGRTLISADGISRLKKALPSCVVTLTQ